MFEPGLSFDEAVEKLGLTQDQIDGDNNNVISDAPDPSGLISDCEQQLQEGRQTPDDALTCQVIVAKASGDLEPGIYSTPALLSQLEKAGADVSGVGK